jgi:hypothetical protein
MNNVIDVYNNFYLVFIDLIGFYTDGNNLDIGSTRCNNRNPMICYDQQVIQSIDRCILSLLLI